MESDVICLDSDDEGESGPFPSRPSASSTSNDTIDKLLLRPLQALSLELYFGGGKGGNSGSGATCAPNDEQWRRSTVAVKRVAELVQEFGRRKFSKNPQDIARQRDAWKQVLKFLFLLRAIGPESMSNDNQQQHQTPATKGASASRPGGMSCEELSPETRRYRLTVMDVLVDYIRYKCSALAGERNPAVLLAQCNQIVSSLYIIFDGDSEFVTLTLLKMDLLAGSGAVALMYPVFEQILASQTRRSGTPFAIMDYVRLLLCYKKWKAMVPARRDKDAISALALKVLPQRCPQAKTKQDLPFVQMLPRLSASAKEQEDETRFLLAKDLMEIEQLCAIYFREYEKRFFQRNEPKLSPLEVKSNFINIDALADFIQRKCNLLKLRRPPLANNESEGKSSTGPSRNGQRQQLQHESNAIISSLRLIFRRDEEFIALTLLRVETCPECQVILDPVYERFLSCPQLSSTSTCYGVPSFSTNNVESYGRLLLCYIKWKRLYRAEDPGGHWERIDAIALAALPYDFPRAIKRKEVEIKALFPRVAAAAGRRNGRSAKVSVTRALLNSKHVLDNIQEMCLQFLSICSDGRSNRTKALPIPASHIIDDDDADSNDDDVKIIKPEPNSVVVLDSDDDEEQPTQIIDSTDTEMKCQTTTPSSGKVEPLSQDIASIIITNSQENLLMDTVFNTPPPTPKADEDHQPSTFQLPVPSQELPIKADSALTSTSKLQQNRKSVLLKGVNFKISKNIRLRNSREKRQFLTAFRRLISEQCFHINVQSTVADYCLRKTVENSTVFVEIISFADSNPLSMPISLPLVGRNRLEHGEMPPFTMVDLSPSIRLDEPILQEGTGEQSSDIQRVLDDQLIKLLTSIDDLPQLSPASVDFTIFPEELDPTTSIDFLTNDQTPPSSVISGCCLWPNDDFSVFANLDMDSWLEHENATSHELSS